jgi:hypothetical protein
MSKQVQPLATIGGGTSFDAAAVGGNDNKLKAFAEDHDAAHQQFKLSAPLSSEFACTAGTGGSMTASQTKYMALAFRGPNGTSKAGAEISVALGGAQNAVQIVPTGITPNLGYTDGLYVYVSLAGAASGQPKYQCRQADLSAVSNCTIATDGRVVFQAGVTPTFQVVAHPPNTEPAAPSTNGTASIDALTAGLVPVAETTAYAADTPSAGKTRATKTITLADGTVIVLVGVYTVSTDLIDSLAVKIGGLTIARYTYTFDGSNRCTAVAAQEA